MLRQELLLQINPVCHSLLSCNFLQTSTVAERNSHLTFHIQRNNFIKQKKKLYFQVRHITHSRSNNQGEFTISAVVVDWFPEYQGGSVPGLERKFALFVSLHDSVINVAVRRVRLVAIQRMNPAEYRHTCEFISNLYAARQLISNRKARKSERKIATRFTTEFGKMEFDMTKLCTSGLGKISGENIKCQILKTPLDVQRTV